MFQFSLAVRTLAARAAFNKEVIVLKLSSFSRNVKQNRRKNWRLGKYFLGIKNNAELNRWTKKISDICGLSFYFSLPVKTRVACAAFNKEVIVLHYPAFLFVDNRTSHN